MGVLIKKPVLPQTLETLSKDSSSAFKVDLQPLHLNKLFSVARANLLDSFVPHNGHFITSVKITSFLVSLTLSSAAGCKLVFCGILLRSKTTKKRLTTCRAHEVRGAAALCYKIAVLALLYEKLKKLFLAKYQTNFPKRHRKNDNTTTVKTRNLLSNVRLEPSFFQLLWNSHFPKHKTKNTHSSTC